MANRKSRILRIHASPFASRQILSGSEFELACYHFGISADKCWHVTKACIA